MVYMIRVSMTVSVLVAIVSGGAEQYLVIEMRTCQTPCDWYAANM